MSQVITSKRVTIRMSDGEKELKIFNAQENGRSKIEERYDKEFVGK